MKLFPLPLLPALIENWTCQPSSVPPPPHMIENCNRPRDPPQSQSKELFFTLIQAAQSCQSRKHDIPWHCEQGHRSSRMTPSTMRMANASEKQAT
ncbi:hypothetical protein PGT21_008975 [Puccinia graminis f. sp. tritici]|uniref:Uncharacterized protein n=1 Tax=Puccinia graminis f. sp. tritici TaxID=56615 RepID=A0A5B0MV15_PUCGR|nr:hypothetical protein PGT21_008975 [Puccinia graminis f. sp. tritici]KAA1131441.1 hypothetical protein PGTUg99_014775 [Puccinia graminis f. sp. tritici]